MLMVFTKTKCFRHLFQEGTSDILSIVKFGEAPENKAVYTIKVSDVLSCLTTKKVII